MNRRLGLTLKDAIKNATQSTQYTFASETLA